MDGRGQIDKLMDGQIVRNTQMLFVGPSRTTMEKPITREMGR